MCIITSVLFAIISAPSVMSIYASQGLAYFAVPLLCGGLWGLSAIGFSKGIGMIGMSLVYGISMGISTVVGSVTHLLTGESSYSGTSAILFYSGLILTIVGVVVVTVAGIKRDGGAKGSAIGIALTVFQVVAQAL